MNIRKPTDYTTMFAALDTLMAAQLPQMELYCEIGRLVSGRSEKGTAVAASEYLRAAYPAVNGFSPRNLRRMRDFYRMYGNTPELLAAAMRLNWTQNVVIMEAGLTMNERCWYIRKTAESGLSKTELLRMIERAEHSEIALGENACPLRLPSSAVTTKTMTRWNDTLLRSGTEARCIAFVLMCCT